MEEVNIMEDILTSIKDLLGISDEDPSFDSEIIVHINSVFSMLNDIGVGPSDTFHIDSNTHYWNEFLTDNKLINMVKTYMYLRIKLIFDPPSNSVLLESINKQINEFEWRLNVEAENKK